MAIDVHWDATVSASVSSHAITAQAALAALPASHECATAGEMHSEGEATAACDASVHGVSADMRMKQSLMATATVVARRLHEDGNKCQAVWCVAPDVSADAAWFIVRSDDTGGKTTLCARFRYVYEPQPAYATYMSQPVTVNTVYTEGVFANVGSTPESFRSMYGAVPTAATAVDEYDVLAISENPSQLGELEYPYEVVVEAVRVITLPPPSTSGQVYIVPYTAGYTEHKGVWIATFTTVKQRAPLAQGKYFENGIYNEDTSAVWENTAVQAPPRSIALPAHAFVKAA